jgi:succinate dehydrogenase flavin-adding protein (antitoxin of CptAB toxin-antitoxin module)
MLELDILLEKFILQGGHTDLDREQLARFAWLLEQPDPTLLEWFTGKEKPDDAAVIELIALIRRADD